ncbi:hypothetical protein CU669_04725 [Paramagnetospirillum kuznetsovii]|uniref:Uncharacterized protein n=1 Tax=Paramagnetospirillum kuznetsovii TaxID=2053833 RepID=A0A364P2X5_9PROT|nr:hypothetical protein CU669_04725 [Paramagnetospirillum kuznetsovii]
MLGPPMPGPPNPGPPIPGPPGGGGGGRPPGGGAPPPGGGGPPPPPGAWAWAVMLPSKMADPATKHRAFFLMWTSLSRSLPDGIPIGQNPTDAI